MQRLHNAPEAARWLRERVTGELRTDSRLVGAGDAFIAWPGAATDGRQYLAQALAQGASACLLEDEGHAPWLQALPEASSNTARLAVMKGLKSQTGWVADAYYEQPSQALSVLAVTGTNGKTSTAWWLAQALSSPALHENRGAGREGCGLVGTLGVGQWPHVVSTGMTTPDPVLLQRQFRQFVDQGLLYCAIEASSIGLSEQRLDGTQIRVAMFTNFTQDHLDYHGDMARYWAAKEILFSWPGLQAAVINIDDLKGAELAARLADSGLDIWTCSRQGPARLQAKARASAAGLVFDVTEGAEVQTLHTGLMGDFNIDNLLAVLGSLRALGFDLSQSAEACAQVTAVPGRMHLVSTDAQNDSLPLVVVDYAHTPDAVTHALTALRPQAATRGGRLWCVVGCGGERDASKRPLMAAAAERAADRLVLTSDNPRSESPEAILAEMASGLSRPDLVTVQVDRAAAIAQVVASAAAQDVILLAGKGHETVQEIRGARVPFSDVLQAQQALQRRAADTTRVAAGGVL